MRNNSQFFRTVFCFLCLLAISFLFTKNMTQVSENNQDNTVVNHIETETITTQKEPFEGITLKNNNIKIPVLGYHSIDPDDSNKSPISISVDLFKEHMQVIHDNGYTTLTMKQLEDCLLHNKPIPEKSVVITFDDGYLNNYTLAFPVLKEFNMNATIFIISSLLDGNKYMTPENVKELSNYGIDIQGHTVSHGDLATLSYEEQLKELKDSKEYIENITDKPVFSIAYPFGSYNEDTLKASKDAGYTMSFTVKRGLAEREDKQYEIDRILIDYTFSGRDLKRALING